MHMAVGDTRGTDERLREVPPSGATDVRQFDQLGHREQHAVFQLYEGNQPSAVPLDAGEVVVFTDYYQVER
jgi:hypothetical protein